MAYFSLSDMLQFIRANPQLADLNSHVERRWSQYRNWNRSFGIYLCLISFCKY